MPSCCCKPTSHGGGRHWIDGAVATCRGDIPTVTTTWTWRERLGAVNMRMNIGRMRYTIPPGLYAAGRPTPDSPVFVTSNYKFSFDHLRRALTRIDSWILVLDTHGINVWCAAADGDFGTEELVQRIADTGLRTVVSHRRLIAPQLGAPGIAAHDVKRQSGFDVIFGPVQARDIPAFLEAGMRATVEMREVPFGFTERLVLAPVEFMKNAGYLILCACVFAIAGGTGPGGYTTHRIVERLPDLAYLVLSVAIAGFLVLPAFMPWLPGRALSLKGAFAGLVVGSAFLAARACPHGMAVDVSGVGFALMSASGASMLGLVFTGSSAHTSLSGVERETRLAIPLQIVGLLAGLGLWLRGAWPS